MTQYNSKYIPYYLDELKNQGILYDYSASACAYKILLYDGLIKITNTYYPYNFKMFLTEGTVVSEKVYKQLIKAWSICENLNKYL